MHAYAHIHTRVDTHAKTCVYTQAEAHKQAVDDRFRESAKQLRSQADAHEQEF